ncbi:MAG: outer membrane beta-barrel protein [Janthinobacterium lividum]
MKQVTTFSLATLLLSTGAASAQTTFRLGVRGGANRALTTVAAASNSTGTYPYSYAADKSAIYAWQGGLIAEWARGKFALQPGLQFSQKGEKFNTSTTISGITGDSHSQTVSTNRCNWLELPLNLVYTLHGDYGLQLFAGPYVALAVGGRQRGTTYPFYGPAIDSKPFDFDKQAGYGPDTNNRRLDAGVNFGVGYRQGPVQVQLGYSLGLRNLHQATQDDMFDPGFFRNRNFNADAAYNRVAQLTGSYFFSL